jgi:hypothetical protein
MRILSESAAADESKDSSPTLFPVLPSSLLYSRVPLSQLLPSAPRFLTIFSFQFSIGYFQLSPLECADP